MKRPEVPTMIASLVLGDRWRFILFSVESGRACVNEFGLLGAV